MDRSNHYELAFEGYVQWHRHCSIAIDESRRSFLGPERVKSLDFIVHGENGTGWLLDIKGRRYPGGTAERPRRIFESWSTQEDIASLQRWARRFGPAYQAALVFMYEIQPFAPEMPEGALWTWHGRRYLLRAIPVADYRQWMRVRSPRWGTVSLPNAAFRRLARPFATLLSDPATATPYASGKLPCCD
jgi:hypothetical protein